MGLDWRDPKAYDFCQNLTSAQWAWEFLRRNPEYRRQWQEFWETWQALEADHGRPPDRDFCAWKNDPRAWVPAEECPEGDCRIDGDKVLIECALGARWGFHKFPPDPADDDPVGAGRLSWRDVQASVPVVTSKDDGVLDRPQILALAFDLSLPLRPQLEQARRQLSSELALRRRRGEVTPQRVSRLRDHWTLLLRLLDAEAAGELTAFAEEQGPSWRALQAEAHALRDGGYRRLLAVPD